MPVYLERVAVVDVVDSIADDVRARAPRQLDGHLGVLDQVVREHASDRTIRRVSRHGPRALDDATPVPQHGIRQASRLEPRLARVLCREGVEGHVPPDPVRSDGVELGGEQLEARDADVFRPTQAEHGPPLLDANAHGGHVRGVRDHAQPLAGPVVPPLSVGVEGTARQHLELRPLLEAEVIRFHLAVGDFLDLVGVHLPARRHAFPE
mmetsp:Transcript_4347/g.9660  ORF Transcript_4347/g.9660 Transcript_4347/m.9660 type:complete len:208 (-) Transcript_4347:1416-2039(-)